MRGSGTSRRAVLSAIGAMSVAVAGFDCVGRRWVAAADAATNSSMKPLPPLDGTVRMDELSRRAHARDAGNIVELEFPYAVLEPGSVRDIQVMIRYCIENQISTAANTGQNSTFGQTLVPGGLVIQSGAMARIHSLDESGALVDAGVLWRDLIRAAYEKGLRPPSITGYTQLGVGGTLSIGGLAAIDSNRRPSQVDEIQYMEVVTGTGELVRCSESENADLFHAMCAGLGQCGVITKVKVNLIPAPDRVRFYRAPYLDTSEFFRDARTLLTRSGQPGGFDWVASVNLLDDVGLVSLWAAIAYNVGSEPPPTDVLMRGCSPVAGAGVPVDLGYLEYVNLLDVLVDGFRASFQWDQLVKPWFNMILPDQSIELFVDSVFPTLTPEDVTPTTFVLISPLLREHFTRPLYRVPGSASPWVWVCGILTNSTLPVVDSEYRDRMLDRNYRWYTQAKNLGGTRYLEDSIPFTQQDWEQHYGTFLYTRFRQWKQRFDPHGILAPGAGVF